MAIPYTDSATFTVADVEAAFRRFKSDIFMIADSTGAISRSEADDYAHDAEFLARRGYLKKVDITLLCAGVELKAATYTVNEDSGRLESSRPGGVLWPRLNSTHLRVIFSRTPKFTNEVLVALQPSLRISWGTTTDDIAHSRLAGTGGRNYISNGYGLQRMDFG